MENRIFVTIEKYSRTASGKNWKKQPDSVERVEVSRENYNNRTARETIQFFNGFCGGKCRAEYGYSFIGYTPRRITLINPGNDQKTVEKYDIE